MNWIWRLIYNFLKNSSPRQNEISEEDDEEMKFRNPEAYYGKLLNDSKAQIDLPIKKPVLNFKKGNIFLICFIN